MRVECRFQIVFGTFLSFALKSTCRISMICFCRGRRAQISRCELLKILLKVGRAKDCAKRLVSWHSSTYGVQYRTIVWSGQPSRAAL